MVRLLILVSNCKLFTWVNHKVIYMENANKLVLVITNQNWRPCSFLPTILSHLCVLKRYVQTEELETLASLQSETRVDGSGTLGRDSLSAQWWYWFQSSISLAEE